VKGQRERERETLIRSSRRVDERKRHGGSERYSISGGEKGHHYVRRFPGFARSSF